MKALAKRQSELQRDLNQIAETATKAIVIGIHQVGEQALLEAIERLRTRLQQRSRQHGAVPQVRKRRKKA